MLEPMPITLGDFLYGYAEGCSINSDADRRMLWAMQCIRDLRGTNHLPADSGDLAQRLHRALQKRIDRQERQKHQPLPLFCSDLDLNEWLSTQRSYARAWHQCERGDWLLRIAARIRIEHRSIVRAACDCARTALRYVPEGEDRPRIAIETTEAWCDGDVTIGQVLSADVNAGTIDVYAADDAAYAAARAASAAVHTAVNAIGAPDAAADAAEAASAAYGVDYFKTLKHHADLVRSRIPCSAVRDVIRTKEHRRLP